MRKQIKDWIKSLDRVDAIILYLVAFTLWLIHFILSNDLLIPVYSL